MLEQTYAEAGGKLKMARSELERAQRDMARAAQQREQADRQAEAARRAAGLASQTSGLTVALKAMQDAAQKDLASADAQMSKARLLRPTQAGAGRSQHRCCAGRCGRQAAGAAERERAAGGAKGARIDRARQANDAAAVEPLPVHRGSDDLPHPQRDVAGLRRAWRDRPGARGRGDVRLSRCRVHHLGPRRSLRSGRGFHRRFPPPFRRPTRAPSGSRKSRPLRNGCRIRAG